MFEHEFIRNAFLATAALAPACGLTGYFSVTRNDVFAADALSHVAFTGSLAALAIGVDLRFGLFASTLAVGALLGLFGQRARIGDTQLGVLFTAVLGFGVLFLSLFTSRHSACNSNAGPSVLFGSIFGISHAGALQSLGFSLLAIICVLFIARPLLFASVDNAVASARGVPTKTLSVVFGVVLAIVVSEAAQTVGALLLLGLIATPAAAAQRLVKNPYAALLTTALLTLAYTWLGLTVAYTFPSIPPSFAIIAISFCSLILATTWQRVKLS